MDNLKLSIVIPVYHSENILPKLVYEVDSAMRKAGFSDSFELIFINDASTDGSWDCIKQLFDKYKFINGLSLMKNFGQHNATMAGLNFAQGEVIVIMDDDLQHPPSEIPRLVNAIETGADVCYVNYLDRQHVMWKKLGSWFCNLAATILLGKPQGLYLSSFKAIRRAVVTEIIRYDGPFVYVDGLILNVTQSIASIEIQHSIRHDGVGNYNIRRSISLWLKMVTSFSITPLRLASISGATLAFLSLILIVVIVIQKLNNPEIQAGWASLIATVLFIGGAQLACIGMLGEYLGRAYLKLNKQPQFVVREILSLRSLADADDTKINELSRSKQQEIRMS